jgi:hypothetical protein
MSVWVGHRRWYREGGVLPRLDGLRRLMAAGCLLLLTSRDGNGDIPGGECYPVPAPDTPCFPRSPSPIPVSGMFFSRPRPRLE